MEIKNKTKNQLAERTKRTGGWKKRIITKSIKTKKKEKIKLYCFSLLFSGSSNKEKNQLDEKEEDEKIRPDKKNIFLKLKHQLRGQKWK